MFGPAAADASAQDWPDRPITLADGRITVGGDVTLTVGSDDNGFFNYTDYERSTLRLMRFGVVASLRATPHLSFLTELRAEGDSGAGQWSGQSTRHTSGFSRGPRTPSSCRRARFRRRSAGSAATRTAPTTCSIGYPWRIRTCRRCAPTPCRARPTTSWRCVGAGGIAYFPVGSDTWNNGVPPISVFKYDTGVLAKLALPARGLEVSTSVTAGTLSFPGLDDHNGAPQVAARVVARPLPGLAFGVSGSRARSSTGTCEACCRGRSPTSSIASAPSAPTSSSRAATGSFEARL